MVDAEFKGMTPEEFRRAILPMQADDVGRIVFRDYSSRHPELTPEQLCAVVEEKGDADTLLNFTLGQVAEHPNTDSYTLKLIAQKTSFSSTFSESILKRVVQHRNTDADTLYYILVKCKSLKIDDILGVVAAVAKRRDLPESLQELILKDFVVPNLVLLNKQEALKLRSGEQKPIKNFSDFADTALRMSVRHQQLIDDNQKAWIRGRLMELLTALTTNPAVHPEMLGKIASGAIILGEELLQLNILMNPNMALGRSNPKTRETLEMLMDRGTSDYVKGAAKEMISKLETMEPRCNVKSRNVK